MNLIEKFVVLNTFILVLCLSFMPALNRHETKTEMEHILDMSLREAGMEKRKNVIYVMDPQTRTITIKEAVK